MAGGPAERRSQTPSGPANLGWLSFETAANAMLVVAAFCLALPMFFLSCATALFLIALLLSGQFARRWQRLRDDPVCRVALALLVLICLAIAWSPADLPKAIDGAWHYRGLLLLILARTLVDDGRWALRIALGFLAGVALSLAGGYLRQLPAMHETFAGACSFGGDCGRIGFSLLLALACFTMFGLWRALPRQRPLWLVLGLACGHFLFFVNVGRTGQLAALLLIPLLLWQSHGARGALAGLALAAVAAGAVVATSDGVRHRLQAASGNLARIHDGDYDSSEGQRYDMYTNVARLIARHPLAGGGTGSLAVEFPTLARSSGPHPTLTAVTNAHNDYLMLWTQQGILGPVLLLGLWIALWRSGGRLPPLNRWLTRGLVLAYATACLSNSLLLDTRESHALALLAVGFGLPWRRAEYPADDGR